jgi:hypothetical protein
MLFEGENSILVLPRVSGETGEIYYNKGYFIVSKEIHTMDNLNHELREANREINTKFLGVKYF